MAYTFKRLIRQKVRRKRLTLADLLPISLPRWRLRIGFSHVGKESPLPVYYQYFSGIKCVFAQGFAFSDAVAATNFSLHLIINTILLVVRSDVTVIKVSNCAMLIEGNTTGMHNGGCTRV